MKCKIDITAQTDLAAWVSKDAFFNNIDLDDLACRESEVICDWYHSKWFRKDEHGELYFTPPAFAYMKGHLMGINGRHRALLLYKHTEIIPMLLVLPHEWPKDKLEEIVHERIGNDEIIELPDLPINSEA